jgi:PAS domain S-box-containing protein
MRAAMQRRGPTSGDTVLPAPSYAAHRGRALAAAFPTAVAVIVAVTLIYAVADLVKTRAAGQAASYALELAIPVLGLLLARGALRQRAEAVALGTDLAFTAVLAGRLLLPTTTISGTALFLSLKLLATALLFPWQPPLQYLSAVTTILLYYAAIVLGGRTLDATHQLAGPLIGAVLSCVGAAVADRTRKALWQQSADLTAAERRTRTLLDAERVLAAVAREIAVLTDLHTALERINSLTAAALGCDFSNTYLIDDQRREATAAATNASDPAMRAQIMAVRRSFEIPVLTELLHGRTVVINDRATQTWFDPAELAQIGVHCLALTPITAKGAVVGVLTVSRTQTAQPFDEREVSLLKAIAAQAATAIENARLFEGLTASEARYRDLFERATDLIFVVEEDGALRCANRAALDFIQASGEGLLPALRWQDVVTDAVRRQIERRIALARRRGTDSGRPFEIDVRVPGASHAVLEVRARLITAPDQPRAYHCIARDVTERRQQERETQQLLFKLREANRLQGEFVANMSHELRTPLNVIIGYADLLADEPGLALGSDARFFLQRVSSAGRALHRLVESVLEYARLDRGRTVVLTTRFTVTSLLGELRELCDDVRSTLDVALAIQDESDISMSSDYDRLYSILSNLLLNALKFTPAGRIELRVDRAGMDALFTVRDTGIGIAPEALAQVFEAFRQVDGSPTRSYGGVGLGLAIVRRNAELLRGHVAVQSEVGVGTTFVVRIPISLEADAEVLPTSTAA